MSTNLNVDFQDRDASDKSEMDKLNNYSEKAKLAAQRGNVMNKITDSYSSAHQRLLLEHAQ